MTFLCIYAKPCVPPGRCTVGQVVREGDSENQKVTCECGRTGERSTNLAGKGKA